ncbi:cupin domain-containing protein [Candidatus Woesearchaeota archaeon]|nr:cupin domain-containing protein [Candidatus Woesearchaeota archaeon]
MNQRKRGNKVNSLYETIRNLEKKVPSLYVQNSQIDKPSLSIDKPLIDVLETKVHDERVSFYLDGIHIVTYCQGFICHIGKVIDIDEDLKGRLFFNSDFFKQFDVPKTLETSSDMRNIAKTFFEINKKNYVMLTQYLAPYSSSSEHCHTLDEIIIQLAGRSFLEMRPMKNDMERKVIELNPGDIYEISLNNLHQIYTYDRASITIPIKQTINGKKDHIYPSKSKERLSSELDALIRIPHYNSGNEILSALEEYKNHLNDDERKNFKKLIEIRVSNEKNPNIRRILEEFKNYSQTIPHFSSLV